MKDKIKNILNVDGIDVCFLFGSYGTSRFNDDSDFNRMDDVDRFV